MRLADCSDMSATLLSRYTLPASSPFESVGHAMLAGARVGILARRLADAEGLAALFDAPAHQARLVAG